MPRTSAFQGTWEENKRPYIVLAPDAYVAIQGQTRIVTCGECNRTIDVNKYVTGISTEASVDSPPGSGTINLSVPDTDVNDLYVEGNFVIIPMMEIEIFAKGYYTVGGLPQYYRIFWGMITNISKSWSNGVTTFTISCKDILHWWEKTNIILNPAFVGNEGASCGYQLFQNQFAGLNPYTIIISLAKEAMGDFSITDGSFMSFKPEAGPETAVVGQYAKDVMAYWQLKFGNIWNALVLYGTSGSAYTFEGAGMDVSPLRLSNTIFKTEASILSENQLTASFKVQPHEIAAFKVDVQRAGDVQFFQNDTQSKLSVALTARDQIAYEFYCDTTGDIIFKPPFYNLNVIPNKPVSWINDFEIIDDNINDSEAEVITHMTSSGNAFGGVTDWGLTDEITIPRTGVIDWHLLKRYGWRRQDFQCEWAGNPKKLFWFLIDYMDRINAKRQNGSVTIPMRPEVRMGFPVWVPHYDSFYYVNAVSHNYTPGGQATTTLTLSAKRSKFIAPKNLGRIERVPSVPSNKPAAASQANKSANKSTKADVNTSNASTRQNSTYKVTFDGSVGQTAGLGSENQTNSDEPLILRDPTTGKLLGYPNVVMVYRTTFSGMPLANVASSRGNVAAHTKSTKADTPSQYRYDQVVRKLYTQLRDDHKTAIISRIRHLRYEAGMTNAGLYDYAVDTSGDFKEMVLIPVTSILWGSGTDDPTQQSGAMTSATPDANKGKSKGAVPGGKTKQSQTKDQGAQFEADRNSAIAAEVEKVNRQLNGEKSKGKSGGGLIAQQSAKFKELDKAKRDFLATVSKNHKGQTFDRLDPEKYNADEKQKKATMDALQSEYDALTKQVKDLQSQLARWNATKNDFRLAKNLSVSVRPVSDEFGFEVIGHNRYGRGVFVDRNHLRLKFTNPTTNELRIQFAATANMLTNPPSNLKFGLQSDTTPEAFEKMQPDDWVTGASTHTSGQVTLTSAGTFSSAINHEIEAHAQIGAIFVEADATRRAKTIWELQPTVSTGLDEVGFPQCNCKMSRFEWYSLLPKAALDEILAGPVTSYGNMDIYTLSGFTYVDALTGQDTTDETTRANRSAADAIRSGSAEDTLRFTEEERANKLVAIYEKKDANNLTVGTIRKEVSNAESAPKQIEVPNTTSVSGGTAQMTTPDFFKILNQYLVNRFEESFEYNKERENQDVGLDLGVEVLATGPEDYTDPNSILGPGGQSLFDRAALGDPQALETLQNQVDWDWSESEKAREDLVKTSNEAGKQINEAWQGLKKSAVPALTAGLNPVNGISATATSSQPQPVTPAPLKTDTAKRSSSYDDAQQTNPFSSTSHTGVDGLLPSSPPAPAKKP